MPGAVDRAALHDPHRRTVLGELSLAEGPGQEAALVGVALYVDQVRAVERGRCEDHAPERRATGATGAASGARRRVVPPPEALGPG